MGVLHVQSLLLQTLAREEDKVKGLAEAKSVFVIVEEMSPQLALLSDSQDLQRDVGSAVATLWT